MNKDIILINKMCTGSYTTNNIGHEIINFFKDDNGDNYCYVLPYGGYSNNYKGRINKLILTSSLSNQRVEILAIADIDYSKEIYIDGNRGNKIIHKKQIEQLKNITYGGQKLEKIFAKNYGNEEAIYVTFKIKNLIKPKDNIKIYISNNIDDKNKPNIIMVNKTIPSSSLKGYFIKGETYNDYENIMHFVNNNSNKYFEKYTTYSLKDKSKNLENIKSNINSLQIMDKENEEQIYTNLINYWFSRKNIFKKFLQEMELNDFLYEYELKKEKRILHGRMDIFALNTDINKAIIIENKILSGLNGIDRNEEKTQLDKYIEDIENDYNIPENSILGLVFVPDYNLDIIKNEIDILVRKNNSKFFKVIPYSKLITFFENIKEYVSNDLYYEYYEDFIKILKSQTYTSISEKNRIEMENKFLLAIKNAKNNV